jgi:hypothetical protein
VTAGLACGALWTIGKGIDAGDIVLSPDGAGSYRVGEVTGGYYYIPGGTLSHRRKVKWLDVLIARAAVSEPLKLAAVWDRTKQGHTPHVFSCCKFFFVCGLIGGRAATSHETSEVGWFHEANIPAELSLERVLPQQIRRMFAHRRDPSLPTDFD